MNDLNDELVSYLITSYNHLDYIKNAIDSVLNQTYKNIELIVCDDCSTDGSVEFLEKYSKEKNFYFIENDHNIGASRNTQKLADLANGKYMCFLASDDWVDDKKVEKQINFLKKSGKDAVYSPVISFYEDKDEYVIQDGSAIDQIVNSGETLEHIYKTGEGAGLVQSAMYKSECVKNTGFVSGYKSDDFCFQIRFLQSGYSIGYLNEPLCYYRLHSSNSHNDALYCLNELELPVIKDFIPIEYRNNLISRAYATASEKFFEQKNFKMAHKMQLKSISKQFRIHRLCRFIKMDVSNLMKRLGLHDLYMKIRYGGNDKPLNGGK